MRIAGKLQQLGLPLVGELLTQDPLLVDRTLEGGSRYPISDADSAVYRHPFLKSSAAGRSLLATVRQSLFREYYSDELVMSKE